MLKRNFYYSRTQYKNRFAKNDYSGFSSDKVDDKTLPDRIRKLFTLEETKDNQFLQSFLPSILEQFEKKGYLSQKQVDILEKNEKLFDPQNIESRRKELEEWAKEYDDEKREAARKVAEYYREQYDRGAINTFYYEKVATQILENPDYIPSRKQYEKMVNNKYAQQWLKNSSAKPKYSEGDWVELNASSNNYYNRNNFWKEIEVLKKAKTAVIVDVKKPRHNRAGATIYCLLPVGSSTIVELEERLLKKTRGI
jgi:hypothetical protein